MRKALEDMPNYRKNVSAASKVFTNVRYNEHAWKEIGSTRELHDLVISEHEIKNRIVGKSLKIKIALGYNSRNALVDSQDEYFTSAEAMDYSAQKSEIAMSPPELKITGLKARKQSWNIAHQVENFSKRSFQMEESSLYHGFTKEHKSIFTQVISSFLKGGSKDSENEHFFKVLNDDNLILTQNEISKYILHPYYNYGNYNSTEGQHPEREKFPPSNVGINCPPTFKDWKSKNGIMTNSSAGVGGSDEISNSLVSILGTIVKNNSTNANTDENTSTDFITLSDNSSQRRVITFSYGSADDDLLHL